MYKSRIRLQFTSFYILLDWFVSGSKCRTLRMLGHDPFLRPRRCGSSRNRSWRCLPQHILVASHRDAEGLDHPDRWWPRDSQCSQYRRSAPKKSNQTRGNRLIENTLPTGSLLYISLKAADLGEILLLPPLNMTWNVAKNLEFFLTNVAYIRLIMCSLNAWFLDFCAILILLAHFLKLSQPLASFYILT